MPTVPFFSLSISGLWAGVIALIVGILIVAIPRIVNYTIAIVLVVAGVLWLAGGDFLPGIVSLIFGIAILVLPVIWNYTIALYLVLLGLWLIFFGASGSTVPGIVSLIFGVIVLIFPAIINYIIGIYLIVLGFLAIANYYNWFGATPPAQMLSLWHQLSGARPVT